MTFRAEAIKVLERAGKPLHYMEILHGVERAGIWKSDAEDPGKTARSSLLSDIRRHEERSPFVRTGRATFALRAHVSAGQEVTRPRPNAPVAHKFTPPTAVLSHTDCAELVLESTNDKLPLYCARIIEIAHKDGLLHTREKTSELTMATLIGSENRRKQERGENPRFVIHADGRIGLSKWGTHGLAKDIEVHNDGVRRRLRERLLDIDPGEFEALIQRLLEEMGFEDTEVTRRSKDGGIDVRGTLNIGGVIPITVAIQAKRWALPSKIQAQEVRQVRGSLNAHEQGIIVTTSDFSQRARDEARQKDKSPIALINGGQLVVLLTRHSGAGEIVGVRRSNPQLLELSEEFTLAMNGE